MRLTTSPGSDREIPRIRILIWALVAGLVLAGLGIGQPLDALLRSGRDVIAAHPASGTIAVVAIDDRSLQQAGNWPWPRRYYAQISDALLAAGASEVYFDIVFSSHSSPADDHALNEAFRRARGRVTLAGRASFDPTTRARREMLPIAELGRWTRLGTIDLSFDPFGAVSYVPFSTALAGRETPSFASLLAGRTASGAISSPVDFSIELSSVPTYSAIDVLNGRVPRDAFRGRKVVIGATADLLHDNYLLIGRGFRPGVFFHVLGAETLMAGRPRELGSIPPLGLALLLAWGSLAFRTTRNTLIGFFLSFGVLLSLPYALERALIFVEIMPSLVLLLVAGGRFGWLAFRRSYRKQGTTNRLTGLPNLQALRQTPAGVDQDLVVVRVRNFAEVTAALPPEKEKALVEQIVDRLAIGTPGRAIFQGDEGIFAWLVAPGPIHMLGDHLEALHALFRSPVTLGQSRVDLVLSFGVDTTRKRSVGNRLGSALVAADEAAAEGLRWKLYDPANLADAEWKLSILSQLDSAIDSGDVWVAYQPKFDLASRAIIGAEALVRWTHRDKGPISPADFIPIVEQSNRIEKLTFHVLETAIATAAAVRNATGRPFGIAVNLSTRMIAMPGLVQAVAEVLQRHRLPPGELTLEVTETATLADSEITLPVLEALRARGVHLSVDDYGTGLSTLDYLKRIPAGEIKIDKSFVQSIDQNHSDRLMVNSTIQLAHSLGRKVVAEGVERSETLEALGRMGCDSVQGYLLGRPMPAAELDELVRAQEGKAKLSA